MMTRSISSLILAVLVVVSMVSVLDVIGVNTESRRAVVLKLDMNIDGGAVSFVETVTAKYRGHVFVLVINSYGGYLSSADRIISAIENNGGECLAWIPPSGYAVSAAAYIALYCSRTYMGSASVIGGVKPIPYEPKVAEYIRARLTSFLEQRGIESPRELAIEIVEKARTFTASEAVELGLARVAESIEDIVRAEGLVIVDQVEPSLWDKLLSLVSHPLISQLLLFVGIILVLIEVYTTGFQGYGIAGVLMILLALYGLTIIPVDILIVGLISAGAVLIGVEILTPGFGAFGISGSILTLIGFILMLTRLPAETITGLVLSTMLGLILIAGLFIFIGIKAVKAMSMKRVSIAERLVGSIGIAKTNISDTEPGVVYLLNEDWTALSTRGVILAGSKVKVVKVDGLKLIVEAVEEHSE